jgi:hypothetical protein
MTSSIKHQTYKICQGNNPKKLDLITGYHELHKPTHRIGTNGMPQSSLGMESQGFKIQFNTHNT